MQNHIIAWKLPKANGENPGDECRGRAGAGNESRAYRIRVAGLSRTPSSGIGKKNLSGLALTGTWCCSLDRPMTPSPTGTERRPPLLQARPHVSNPPMGRPLRVVAGPQASGGRRSVPFRPAAACSFRNNIDPPSVMRLAIKTPQVRHKPTEQVAPARPELEGARCRHGEGAGQGLIAPLRGTPLARRRATMRLARSGQVTA